MTDNSLKRKQAHLDLAAASQTDASLLDHRFNYEPLFFAHDEELSVATKFLGHNLDFPLWISSMTGGVLEAQEINSNLSKLAGKYKLAFALGSCRPLLESDDRLGDFNFRKNTDGIIFANLGIAQVEQYVLSHRVDKIHELVKRLEVNGLIIHLNPLQEWFQPSGDRFKQSPLKTIKAFLDSAKYPVIIKEVGHGLGPKSLEALLGLNIAGIEFAAFGGTNFSKLEALRGDDQGVNANFINVGHTALEMVSILNELKANGKEFIISGGIKDPLDALYLQAQFKHPSVFGIAHSLLPHARVSFEALEKYYLNFKEAYVYGKKLLEVKEV